MNKIKIDNDKFYSNVTKKLNVEYIKNEGIFSINELSIDVKTRVFANPQSPLT